MTEQEKQEELKQSSSSAPEEQMTDEEKVISSSKDDEEKSQSESSEEQSSGEDSSENEPSGNYYQQELARVKEENEKIAQERDNYRQGLVNEKDKSKKEEKKEASSEDVEKAVEAQTEKIRKEMTADAVDETIAASSDNEDERELIRHHYENSLRPSGFSRTQIAEDISRAKALANQGQYSSDVSELQARLSSQQGRSAANVAGVQKQQVNQDMAISESDNILLDRAGKKPQDVKKDQ